MLLCVLIFSILWTTSALADIVTAVGKSSLNEEEQLVLDYVNKFRTDPFKCLKELGISIDSLETNGTTLAQNFINLKLEPLTFSRELSNAANAHVDDLLARKYFDHISPDGVGPEERVISFGYQPYFVNEILGAVILSNFFTLKDALGIILRNIFSEVFSNRNSQGVLLLDPFIKELGLSIKIGQIELDNNLFNTIILCLEVATPRSDFDHCIYGRVYRDLDGNGKFTIGEGINNVNIYASVFYLNTFIPTEGVKSQGDGNYILCIPPEKLYRISIQSYSYEIMLNYLPVRLDLSFH